MSAGRKDREAREELARVIAHVTRAHSALHRDDVGAAHAHVHDALGGVPVPREAAEQEADMARFAVLFNELAERMGVRAAYVHLRPRPTPGEVSIHQGGDVATCKALAEIFGRAARIA